MWKSAGTGLSIIDATTFSGDTGTVQVDSGELQFWGDQVSGLVGAGLTLGTGTTGGSAPPGAAIGPQNFTTSATPNDTSTVTVSQGTTAPASFQGYTFKAYTGNVSEAGATDPSGTVGVAVDASQIVDSAASLLVFQGKVLIPQCAGTPVADPCISAAGSSDGDRFVSIQTGSLQASAQPFIRRCCAAADVSEVDPFPAADTSAGFSPPKATVLMGGPVAWQVDGGGHLTETTALGFDLFGVYQYAFTAAGSFTVMDAQHPERGQETIRVTPLAAPASGGVGSPFTITWASAPPSGCPACTYDIQFRSRPTSHDPWSAWSFWLPKHQTSMQAAFVPGTAGQYDFRARVYNTVSRKSSGWSAARLIKVQ